MSGVAKKIKKQGKAKIEPIKNTKNGVTRKLQDKVEIEKLIGLRNDFESKIKGTIYENEYVKKWEDFMILFEDNNVKEDVIKCEEEVLPLE